MNVDPSSISDELKAKALACKTPEELLALAKAEGFELSDDELQSVSGGSWYDSLSDEKCEYTHLVLPD